MTKHTIVEHRKSNAPPALSAYSITQLAIELALARQPDGDINPELLNSCAELVYQVATSIDDKLCARSSHIPNSTP